MVFGADALRRLAPIFQGLTPSCLMLHNVGCNACRKKSTKMAQSGTTYLTVNLILENDLLTTPLPQEQNNDDMKSANWDFSQNIISHCILICIVCSENLLLWQYE